MDNLLLWPQHLTIMFDYSNSLRVYIHMIYKDNITMYLCNRCDNENNKESLCIVMIMHC